MSLWVLLAACHPDPTADSSPRSQCGTGEVLDGDTCVPEACGTGPWGTLPVDAEAVYVDGVTEGDGSADAPLRTLQAGVDLAGSRGGGLVAVAAGTYRETLAIGDAQRKVTLAGRCQELVTLDGSGGQDVPAVEIVGADRPLKFGIQGVAVTGGTHFGVRVERATLTMVASSIRASTPTGLLVTLHSDVTLDDVVITDPPDDDSRGVEVMYGSRLAASHATIVGNTDVGLAAFDSGTQVDLVDVAVLDTAPRPDGTSGQGVHLQEGPTLTATGCTFRGNSDVGIAAVGAGTTAELVDSVVEATLPTDAGGGWGVYAADGAAVTLTGSTVDGNTGVGVAAYDDGTTATLTDTTVRGTLSGTDGSGVVGPGLGLDVDGGASLDATECDIDGNTGLGVFAGGEGTSIRFTGTVVADTLEALDGSGAYGVEVTDGATFSWVGGGASGDAGVGVLVVGTGAAASLEDVDVAPGDGRADGSGGWGVVVRDGASLDIAGGRIDGARGIGLSATGQGTRADLAALVVAGTGPEGTGEYGFGMLAGDGATVTCDGGAVEATTGHGILVSGATLILTDTDVVDTEAGPEDSGPGLRAQTGAAVTVTGGVFERNRGVGVLVTNPGTRVDLEGTTIRESTPWVDGSGVGIEVFDGAEAGFAGGAVNGSTGVGAFASGDGSALELDGVDVTGTARSTVAGFALGVAAQLGARVTANDLTVTATEGPGLYALAAALDCTACDIADNTFAGAVLVAGTLDLAEATITDTTPDAEWGGGFGVYAIGDAGPGTLVLTDSEVGPHPCAAVWLDGPGSYDLRGNTLSGSDGIPIGGWTLHGNAVFAERGVGPWGGTSGLRIADNRLDGAVVAVLLDGASARLEGNTWSGNATDVWQQRCETTVLLTDDDLSGVPTWSRCPEGNILTDYVVAFTTLYLPEVDVEP